MTACPEGVALRLGDHVSTDEILPGRYLGRPREELGRHALEGVDGLPPGEQHAGMILVAGRNFGTGSSREEAPIALAEAGFACIVASSFARIFYRNCVNIGLLAVWSAQLAECTRSGDCVRVDVAAGTVSNLSRQASFAIPRPPAFVADIVTAGGLLPYARGRRGKRLFDNAEAGP
jgi:3-isopropylmalate/(R)-2-methylmalate dehydratase small subunit